MAESGVSTAFAKCFILFMAIVILLQGCLYFGLSIWGLTQENCSASNMDAKENPFQFVMDLIYFIRKECGDASLTNIGGPDSSNNTSVDLDIDWHKSYLVTNRMYIFLIAYAVISGLWIVGSLLVMATVCGPVTQIVLGFCFWPWFLFVLAGSILDVVATGYHIKDIIHTTTVVSTFDYVGISQLDASVMNYLEDYDAYFITPAVVLTCVSSRVVLIWLLNIFGASFCLSLSRVLADQRAHHHHNEHGKKHGNQIQSNEFTPVITAPYSNHHSLSSQFDRPRPEPLNIINATTPTQQLRRQTTTTSPQSQSANAANSPSSSLTPDVVIIEKVRTKQQQQSGRDRDRESSSSNVIADDLMTYHKTDNHPDRLDYPLKPQTPPQSAQLSTASILNTRYSTAGNDSTIGGYPSMNSNQQSPQRVSDELRSQLPWSYTNIGIAKPLVPPKRPQSQQLYPGIPQPDYDDVEVKVKSQQQQQQSTGHQRGDQQSYSRW